jgi:colanic acid/amylovoran biosynthesis glycosyltransferase
MKIAMLVNQFPTLSETFILSQITGLIDRGHSVHIFADQPRKDPTVHQDVTSYGLMQHVSYYNGYRVTPKQPHRRLASAAALVAGQGPRHPGPVAAALNVARYGKQAASLRMLHHVAPFLKGGPYDVVHCHFGTSGVIGAALQRMGAIKAPLITTFYGHDISSYVRSRGPDVYNELFRRGALFTHISAYQRDKLLAVGSPPERTTLHRIGVDIGRFAFAPRTLAPGEPVRLMTTARLVEKKGLEYSIRAVARVAAQHPNIRYRIVGDGKLREQLQALIDELGMAGTIELLGWRSQDEVRELYAQSHLFVLASVTASNGDEEGQGLVLQEAQAMGLPVVCTRHNGFPEGLVEGESGLLVPERDVEALADAIASLVARPERWAAMGQAGRAHVEAHFDNNKLNDRLVEIYQAVVAGKTAAAA